MVSHVIAENIIRNSDIYPIEGRVRLSGGALCPNTGVTCPDIELLPKLTLVLPRLLPPIFRVKFKFAMAI